MAAPDLSNIPTEDLQHIVNGDMSKVSEPVLRYLSGQPQGGPVKMEAPSGLAGPVGSAIKTAMSPLDLLAGATMGAVRGVVAPVAGLAARVPALLQGKDTDVASERAHAAVERAGAYTPQTPAGQAGAQDVGAVGNAVMKPFGAAANAIETAAGPEATKVIESGSSKLNDVIGSLPAAGAVRELAEAAGAARTARGATMAAGKGTAQDLGFRGADSSATGRVLAGETSGPALAAHNAQVGDAVVNSEAGVAHGTTPSYEALANAREPANAVFERTAQSVPEGPISQRAAGMVRSAGQPEGGRVSAGSPQAQAQIDQLRAQLLAPTNRDGIAWTGRNWVNESRGLRQEGYTNIASDDVSNQQLGQAQLDMARAVDAHIDDSLPANGTVSLSDLQDARKALAKNYTAQGVLRGDTYDLRALARVQRADPTLLDGHMKTTADFAASNGEAVGPTSPLTAPSIAKDIGNISLTKPASWVRPLIGAVGRQLLEGGPGTLSRTNSFFGGRPVNQFPARTPVPPVDQPPAPRSAADRMTLASEPGVGGRATPPGTGIPLADLLSHGVEQPAAPGLTAGPMGAPAPQGLPFRVPPESLAGGLELAPEPAPAAGERLGDLAAVQSQGVPEDIVARSRPGYRPRLGDLLQPENLEKPRRFEVNTKGKAKEIK